MSMQKGTWKGRRKGRNRKIANDLRLAAPLLLLTFCFATSATAIAVAEWAPTRLAPPTSENANAEMDVFTHVDLGVLSLTIRAGQSR